MKKLLILVLVTCLGLLAGPLRAEKIRVEVWDNDDGTAKNGWSAADRLNYYLNLAVDPALTFYQSNFSVGPFANTDNYTLRQVAYLRITQAGNYFFETGSDDGSNLWIGNWWDHLGGFDPLVRYSAFANDVVSFPLTEVVMNDYYQGVTWRGGTIHLEPGVYGIMVSFYEGGGGDSVEVRYTKPGAAGPVSLEADLMDLAVWWPDFVQPTALVDYEIWYQTDSTDPATSGFNSTPYTALGYDNTQFPPLDVVLSIEGSPDATGSVDGFTLAGVPLSPTGEYFVTRHRGIFKVDELMDLGLGTDSDDGSLLFVGPWWEEDPDMVLVANNDGLHGNNHWRGGWLENVEPGYIGIETWMYEHGGGEYLAAAYWTTGVPRTLLDSESLVSRTLASGPSPANGEQDVPLDAVLSWVPPVGNPAAETTLYFGEYGGSLVETEPDTETTFDPDLEAGSVYQWRIDVLDPNDNPWGNVPIVRTGSTWTFATVSADIRITSQPGDQMVDNGSEVTLTVVADSGLTPFSYQWKKDGNDIGGAQDATLVIASFGQADNGTYTCEITNGQATVETAGALVVAKEVLAYWPLDADLDDHAEELDPMAAGDKDAVFMVNDPNTLDDIVPDTTVPYIAGKIGNAVEFDGATNFAYGGTWNPNAVSKELSVSLWAQWNGPKNPWQGLIGKRNWYGNDAMMWQIELNHGHNDIGNPPIQQGNMVKTFQSASGGGGANTVQLPYGNNNKVSHGGRVLFSAQHTTNADERAYRAFDGVYNTKWLAFFNTGWLIYDFPADDAYAVTSYAITSGNDAPERDPDNWTLQGSNDGVTWDILDTRTGAAGSWTARNQTVAFEIDNTTAYQMYKLDITKIRTPSANILQISEVELFADEPLDDLWVNIVSTYDGAVARTYINGWFVREAGMSFGPTADASLVFGACEANPDLAEGDVRSEPWGGNLFNGALDEIVLYNYALSPGEVLGAYMAIEGGQDYCFDGTQPAMDFDGNCVVDTADLLLLVGQWMQNNVAE